MLDSSWMLELVGTEYTPGGTNPVEGFDCFGLIAFCLRRGLSIEIPREKMLWRHYGETLAFDPGDIKSYDILFFSGVLDLVDHVGIVIDQRDFIHAGQCFGGVVCSPISQYRDYIRSVGRAHCLFTLPC